MTTFAERPSIEASKLDARGQLVTIRFTLNAQGTWKCTKHIGDHGVGLKHLDAHNSTEAFGTLHRYVTGDLFGVMLMTAHSS